MKVQSQWEASAESQRVGRMSVPEQTDTVGHIRCLVGVGRRKHELPLRIGLAMECGCDGREAFESLAPPPGDICERFQIGARAFYIHIHCTTM
jgi:hypothetical protein